MLALLKTFSWQELLHHPWRSLAAMLAVTAGVALAFAVHLINASAVNEFASANRELSGRPDLVLRGVQSSFDEALLAKLSAHRDISGISPVIEISTYALGPDRSKRVAVQVLGVDPMAAAAITPGLLARPFADQSRMVLFSPDSAFLNAAAQSLLGLRVAPGSTGTAVPFFDLQSGIELKRVVLRGTIGPAAEAATAGEEASLGRVTTRPLVVMDIAAVQDLFDHVGRVSRIDLRLRDGVDPNRFARSLTLPEGVYSVLPETNAGRSERMSQAYRVNLSVLALVALFTGAFLIYSVLSLSVAQRSPRFALLAVLGLTGKQRLQLVMTEALLLGVLASALGVGLGTLLAALAMASLGADLGGGYFGGLAAPLIWQPWAALSYFGLGLLAATVGAWWPARDAQRLPVIAALRGDQLLQAASGRAGNGLLLMLAGALAATLPPIHGLALGAYLGVGLLLTGGVLLLPHGLRPVYQLLSPWLQSHPLLLLAVERGRRMGQGSAMAIGAVMVSLSLAVALTVMVSSFRTSVAHWLDVVLPADLYLRTAQTSAAGETAFLPHGVLALVQQTPGVIRVQASTVRRLHLRADLPAVVLLARPISDAARDLPLLGPLHPVPAGHIGIYVSEAMVDLYALKAGQISPFLQDSLRPLADASAWAERKVFVAGVYRDYVRQFGSVAMDIDTYRTLFNDHRINDLALWLDPTADADKLQETLRQKLDAWSPAGTAALATAPHGLIEMASMASLRASSLRIFDRSFAVTYWLQAVAVGIGLFGIATSFSAQVLARQREFGLLAHAGLTKRQILGLVAAEGCVWTLVGAVAGLLLGLASGFILVEVVNPQSFHWTMEFVIPWFRLLALCLAVLAAGTLTAWLAGRAAASADAVMAVKQDW